MTHPRSSHPSRERATPHACDRLRGPIRVGPRASDTDTNDRWQAHAMVCRPNARNFQPPGQGDSTISPVATRNPIFPRFSFFAPPFSSPLLRPAFFSPVRIFARIAINSDGESREGASSPAHPSREPTHPSRSVPFSRASASRSLLLSPAPSLLFRRCIGRWRRRRRRTPLKRPRLGSRSRRRTSTGRGNCSLLQTYSYLFFLYSLPAMNHERMPAAMCFVISS